MPLIRIVDAGERVELSSPTAMPRAGGFLWNRRMLLQVNCRGFVMAQHMQPDAARYSYGPVPEAQTFMQPEQPLYAHHPGRFVYLRDEDSGELWSLPYEPVRSVPEEFLFSVGRADIRWHVLRAGIEATLRVAVPADDVAELWSLGVANAGSKARRLGVYPCFSVGYMSWMNQSARYRAELGGIVARCVTPYQKLEDYAKIRTHKDCSFLMHDTEPLAFETSREAFEGEGGLAEPDALRAGLLGNGDALYETPVAALQYRVTLAPGESRRFRFLFGPARDDGEIAALRDRYLAEGAFASAAKGYDRFLARGKGCLGVETPDAGFDAFVNHWLPRQVHYHGAAHRLTADPQTRNYLQDGMGMVYVDPAAARETLRRTLAQQREDGSLPEGVILAEGVELKYINRVPHTDHCIWLPVCLQAYLDETGDDAFLADVIPAANGAEALSVAGRVDAALRWLIGNRDARHLSLIAQGDWCDPMNMVGPAGRGVSGWLSIATVHALRLWAGVCRRQGRGRVAEEMEAAATETGDAIQRHLWDGEWFARGITDDGIAFGVGEDAEGRIFLNPQSWAMLANVATEEQIRRINAAVERELSTPFGPMVLAPAYTAMREDVGRLTQKHPGCAENGSVYNHAATFYLAALYRVGEADRAWDALRRLLPAGSEEDCLRRGQLPVFVPNYYRGAVKQFPRTAGRSSQLFHTGAASWLYRVIIEDLFGLRGRPEGLAVTPQLPSHWDEAFVRRRFRGAEFAVSYRRTTDTGALRIFVDGAESATGVVAPAADAGIHEIEVLLPAVS
jgi:cellobionic acid phosphorylase